MTKNKPKILMCSEASFLSSGYSVYAKELLKRLHASGKYEIAEFASYGMINDPRDKTIPWKYYPNAVSSKDDRYTDYTSSFDNAFGKWRFDRIVIDFKPDIVFDIRDYWMNSYQKHSALRPLYRWVVMPTVDSYPQQDEWLDVYCDADAILSYSQWGGSVLSQQSNNKINFKTPAPPAVDHNIFRPLEARDKVNNRISLNIPKDANIIGTVMRNQKRKLIPDLLYSFRLMLDLCESNNFEYGKQTYMYIHTTYPDAGWNIPAILKENSISNRVMFTYKCKKCKKIHANTFSHSVKTCPFCHEKTATFPSVTDGITTEQLNQIYNAFDIYVQYAICEGFGMPQVEAAAAGVPIISIDYSAMSDIVKDLNGYVVKPERFFKEIETEAYRCYPNNSMLIDHLLDYFSLSKEEKDNKSKETQELCKKHYSWDTTANIWMDVFDEIIDKPTEMSWDNVNFRPMPQIDEKVIDSFANNYDLYRYIHKTYFYKDEFMNMRNLNWMKNTDYGYVLDGFTVKPYNKKQLIELLNKKIKHNNIVYHAIYNQDKLTDEDYIAYSKDRTIT